MFGGFDQQELPVGVACADNQPRQLSRQMKQQRDDEPLVGDVVAEVCDAMEMSGQLLCKQRRLIYAGNDSTVV